MSPFWLCLGVSSPLGTVAPREDAPRGGFLSGNVAHRLFVAIVLIFTVSIRFVLAARGGQHFFYDEAKFQTSREAAAILAKGDLRGALVYAIEPHASVFADHIGFKLLGIVPELVENRFGQNDHIPAYFFGLFSSLNVLLIAAIAYRLGGSRRAFDLTLLAASLSATLLIYARFLVPYDLSMSFALLAIWMGVKKPAGYLRSSLVGAFAAWAFFCYYGHWQLAGIAVLLHALWLAGTPLGFMRRLLAAGIGSLGVVLALYGISRMGSGTLFGDMAEITKSQSAGLADFRSGLNTWAYFYYAEKEALFLWVAAFVAALWLEFRGKPAGQRKFLTPLTLVAIGVVSIYAIFVLDSDIRHNLVVHGRHSRQLVPFLILGFGLGLDQLCQTARHGRLIAGFAAVVLVVNAFFTFSVPLAQEFPRDFKARAEAVLKGLPAITDGNSYYRMVNVDHFVLEPEILRTEPMETLLASAHPLQYQPYLYEGESQAEKKLRRSIDHRMRLVRMAVPESERIHGESYGMVKMSLEFPGNRAGFSEPLLSVGPKGNGDLFFVNYLTPTEAELGFENMGQTVFRSLPFAYSPGTRHVLELFSGSLMPDDGRPIAGENAAIGAILRQTVFATLDGQTLFDQPSPRHSSSPGEVFAGVNTVEADAAGSQFFGDILDVTRGGWPKESSGIKGIGQSEDYGPVHLRVVIPAASNGTAEPLVVAGLPGRAVLGYVRIYPDGSARFGIEIWGVGTVEGNLVNFSREKPAEVEYAFGSLFPEVGLAGWNGLSVEDQRKLKHSVRILVNGEVALSVERDTPYLGKLPVYVGRNPIGGSVVNAGYSGEVLLSYRAEFGK